MSKQDNGMELLNASHDSLEKATELKNKLQLMGLFDPAYDLMNIIHDLKKIEYERGKLEGRAEIKHEIAMKTIKGYGSKV